METVLQQGLWVMMEESIVELADTIETDEPVYHDSYDYFPDFGI